MHISKKPGDYNDDWLLRKKDYVVITYEVLRFQQIEDSWFPLKCKWKKKNCFDGSMGTKGIVSKSESIISITNIVLNPDHDALKSFVPDDIPDGAYVKISNFPISPHNIWRDGKIVDANGHEPDLDKLIEDRKKPKKRKAKRR